MSLSANTSVCFIPTRLNVPMRLASRATVFQQPKVNLTAVEFHRPRRFRCHRNSRSNTIVTWAKRAHWQPSTSYQAEIHSHVLVNQHSELYIRCEIFSSTRYGSSEIALEILELFLRQCQQRTIASNNLRMYHDCHRTIEQ